MSDLVKMRGLETPLLAFARYRFAGEFLAVPDTGRKKAEGSWRSRRIRLRLERNGGELAGESSYTDSEQGNTWHFDFVERIPPGASSCILHFEARGSDGAWEEVGSDRFAVSTFDLSYLRRVRCSLRNRFRVLVSGAAHRAGRLAHRLSPRLFHRLLSRGWIRFERLAEAEGGPREVWRTMLTESQRRALWAYSVVGGGSVGSLFQYPPRSAVYDDLPLPDTEGRELPKLTVVTPSFNQGHFLGATMDSVAGGEGARIDYIVMDGGSRDDSVAVIEARAERLKHWQSKPDRGQAAAIAEGFTHIDCGPDDVMAYLNSDDVLCPGTVDFVLRWFALNPEIDAVYGHRIIIDEEGREVGRWILPSHDEEVLGLVDFVPQETLFWRRRIYDAAGGIDPSFQFAMDWDFLLRIRNAGARIVRLPWFLGCFRVHEAQKTQASINDTGAREIKLLRQRENGGRVPPFASVQEAVMATQVESQWYARRLAEGRRV